MLHILSIILLFRKNNWY